MTYQGCCQATTPHAQRQIPPPLLALALAAALERRRHDARLLPLHLAAGAGRASRRIGDAFAGAAPERLLALRHAVVGVPVRRPAWPSRQNAFPESVRRPVEVRPSTRPPGGPTIGSKYAYGDLHCADPPILATMRAAACSPLGV